MIKNADFNPLISVVVPVYNVEKYLPQCLNSITDQVYRNIEVICVDDGSVDESAQLCDEYALKDNRIKVIHKDNEGAVSARKTGLNLVRGDYVAFVDSDDWIENDMYKELIQEIADADVVISNVIRDYGTNSIIEYHKCRCGQYDKERLKREIYPSMICSGRFLREVYSLKYIIVYSKESW